MKTFKKLPLCCALGLALGSAYPTAWAQGVFVQCPAEITDPATGETTDPNVICKHVVGGDGFVNMADGYLQYIFSFADVTDVPDDDVMIEGILAAEFPAPKLVFKEGDEVYLTLSNVGMAMRPDLFDPHTVHFHGFPNASAIFDGVPDNSISINMGASLTYYYKLVEPGTYMYHCHVEAAEHMEMGMLGNLYVNPAQNGESHGGFTQFVYNDGDGSTGYDVSKAIQLGSFDHAFHDASLNVEPLPFAEMKDTYPMLNGRGYPDTVSATPPTGLAQANNGGVLSQPEDARVEATQGDRILLRLTNLNVTRHYTVATPGLTMRVVGEGAKQRVSTTGGHNYYETGSITLGGGEAVDVLIDTANVAAGTYFLHATNMNYLSNREDDYGGMMTEIVIL